MSSISHMVAQSQALPVLVVSRVLEQATNSKLLCAKKSHLGQKHQPNDCNVKIQFDIVDVSSVLLTL